MRGPTLPANAMHWQVDHLAAMRAIAEEHRRVHGPEEDEADPSLQECLAGFDRYFDEYFGVLLPLDGEQRLYYPCFRSLSLPQNELSRARLQWPRTCLPQSTTIAACAASHGGATLRTAPIAKGLTRRAQPQRSARASRRRNYDGTREQSHRGEERSRAAASLQVSNSVRVRAVEGA